MGDFIFGAEVQHMLAREIGSIVEKDGMNNVLLKELHYLLACDFREWYPLYSLGEVVGGNKEKLELG